MGAITTSVKTVGEEESSLTQKENRRLMAIFSSASFLNDLGSDMVYSIWPLFVTEFLKANMAVLGLVDGLGNAIVSLSQAGSGYLSDRLRKRKVFIWTGYLCGSASRVGYALSTAWQHLIPFRILDRSGKIRGGPRDAIVADISTRENRGRNFGFLRTMDHLGAACGVIISILFLNYLGFRSLFLLASIPSLIGALLIFIFVKDRKTREIFKELSLKDLAPNLKVFLMLSAVFALGSFSYSFLQVYAREFGFEEWFVQVLYLVFTVTASFMSIPFGKLADKRGRKFVLVLSYSLWGSLCLGFILIQTRVGILLLFVLYGLHLGAIQPVQRAFVSELSPTEHRASILGTFQMIVGLCALPASVVAGLLWVNFGMSAPFYFSLGLTSLTVALMLFVKEKA
jgi:MFS family permease